MIHPQPDAAAGREIDGEVVEAIPVEVAAHHRLGTPAVYLVPRILAQRPDPPAWSIVADEILPRAAPDCRVIGRVAGGVAVADDLARVVDSVRAAVAAAECAQIHHWGRTSTRERVLGSIAGEVGPADDLAQVVYAIRAAVGAAKRAQVSHRPRGPPERVIGHVAGDVRVSGDLPVLV